MLGEDTKSEELSLRLHLISLYKKRNEIVDKFILDMKKMKQYSVFDLDQFVDDLIYSDYEIDYFNRLLSKFKLKEKI